MVGCWVAWRWLLVAERGVGQLLRDCGWGGDAFGYFLGFMARARASATLMPSTAAERMPPA